MSCERTLPLLPLVALETADAADRTAALDHVAGCARCAAALRELEAARVALSSFTVEEAPATEAAAIRAEPQEVGDGPRRGAARPRFSGFAKAAAALLVVGLGFAWLRGEITIERGAATLRIAWRSPEKTPAEDGLAPGAVTGGATTTEELAAAVDELARHLSVLEAQHERDLLLLADTVDRQQQTRDRGVDRRMHSLEQQTRDGFLYTNEVLDHVVDRLAQAGGANASPAPQDH